MRGREGGKKAERERETQDGLMRACLARISCAGTTGNPPSKKLGKASSAGTMECRGRISVSLSEATLGKAVDAVCNADDRVAALREEHGMPWGLVRKRKEETSFQALVRSVTSQQLAIKAAATIHARLVELCAGEVTPERILEFEIDEMKTVGLSSSKANYIQNIALRFTGGDGEMKLTDKLCREMTDDALHESLTSIKGVGTWTCHMFQMCVHDEIGTTACALCSFLPPACLELY